MSERPARIIYWYTISSLRSDALAWEEGGEPLMPALAEFRTRAASFGRAYAASSSSFISLASSLTGLWPTRLGVRDCLLEVAGLGPVRAFGLDSGYATLPGILSQSGFSTFSHPESIFPGPGDGLGRSFTHPGRLPESVPQGGGLFIYHHARGAEPPFSPTGLALESLGLAGDRERPWPLGPVGGEEGAVLTRLYRAALFDADRAFARAMTALTEAGLWDQALIAVTADRGQELLEHGGLQEGAGLYEEWLRVPLLIKFPAEDPLSGCHGRSFEPRVRLLDLAPTLIHLALGEEPGEMDGRSLVPVLGGEETGDRDLIAFLSGLGAGERGPLILESLAVIKGRFKALAGRRPRDSQRPGEAAFGGGEEFKELFDLAQDPAETANLWAENKERFEELLVLAARASEVPGGGPGTEAREGPGEGEREALAEKLRSLGYL